MTEITNTGDPSNTNLLLQEGNAQCTQTWSGDIHRTEGVEWDCKTVRDTCARSWTAKISSGEWTVSAAKCKKVFEHKVKCSFWDW